MRASLSLLGLLGIFVLVGFLEAPTVSDRDEKSNYYTIHDETESVSSIVDEPSLPDSTQYVLEETREEKGEILEIYREYEIYKDENGIVTNRVPTSNYEYLRYNTEENDNNVADFEYDTE
ncbi:hypothetical protein ACFSTA_17360 [Ornithinibacillus salinisoli]|uniref:DUF3139 domain-containing protein n=1 Tax=Ornithinibacillus salinisoli TaxID=1848459 RepID=A0ABW4W116_9BACI